MKATKTYWKNIKTGEFIVTVGRYEFLEIEGYIWESEIREDGSVDRNLSASERDSYKQ